MGLFIYEHIQPDIKQEEWEKIYNETLFLFEKYPVPLLRSDFEEIGGFKRRVFTTQIIANKGEDDEHWYVFGDAYSLERGGYFRLFKNIKHYQGENPESYKKHILYLEGDKDYVDVLNGETVFYNKTQGYPYHLAIMAAGILIENRMPDGKAFLYGDFEIGQAKKVIEWMNTVLEKPVKLPLCCDAEALYKSLSKVYPDKEELLDICYIKYKGTLLSWLPVILKYEKFDTFLNFYAQHLADSSPDTIGAVRVIEPLARYLDDIEPLIELVISANKLIKEKPDKYGNECHTLEQLLDMLTSRYITFKEEELKPLLINAKNEDDLYTIDDVLNNLFMKFAGKPEFIDRYVSKDELLRIFTKYEPENKEKFEEIIEKNESECKETIDKVKEMSDEKKEESEKQSEESQEKGFKDKYPQYKQLTKTHTYSEEELYILQQTFVQKTRFAETVKAAKALSGEREKVMEDMAKDGDTYFIERGAEDLKKMIYKGSQERGFGLTEKTWENIDNETNIDILRTLALLALNRNDSQNFWKWRYFFMENQSIWKYFIRDKKLDTGKNENKPEKK